MTHPMTHPTWHSVTLPRGFTSFTVGSAGAGAVVLAHRGLPNGTGWPELSRSLPSGPLAVRPPACRELRAAGDISTCPCLCCHMCRPAKVHVLSQCRVIHDSAVAQTPNPSAVLSHTGLNPSAVRPDGARVAVTIPARLLSERDRHGGVTMVG